MVLFLLLLIGCDTNNDKLILKGYYEFEEYWAKNGFHDYAEYDKIKVED